MEIGKKKKNQRGCHPRAVCTVSKFSLTPVNNSAPRRIFRRIRISTGMTVRGVNFEERFTLFRDVQRESRRGRTNSIGGVRVFWKFEKCPADGPQYTFLLIIHRRPRSSRRYRKTNGIDSGQAVMTSGDTNNFCHNIILKVYIEPNYYYFFFKYLLRII